MSSCRVAEAGCSKVVLLQGLQFSSSTYMRTSVEVHLLKWELCLAQSLTGPMTPAPSCPCSTRHCQMLLLHGHLPASPVLSSYRCPDSVGCLTVTMSFCTTNSLVKVRSCGRSGNYKRFLEATDDIWPLYRKYTCTNIMQTVPHHLPSQKGCQGLVHPSWGWR